MQDRPGFVQSSDMIATGHVRDQCIDSSRRGEVGTCNWRYVRLKVVKRCWGPSRLLSLLDVDGT